ncbi:MAG: histidine--tRNA ligase [Spirochaetota bacterium]|jgi:histidyl-tRNA synthetase|nr:histidine--tRNA ligase [Spirochaetota bacterium]
MTAIQKIKGTNDILPDGFGEEIFRSSLWRFAEQTMTDLALRYGYAEIRTPIFESAELFIHSVGEETDIVRKEMFRFTDRGERDLVLRPEGTAGVVRAWIENKLGAHDPVSRLFYHGQMFRAERPQKGRYRQFHQFGVECIGGADARHDVEVIMLFWDLLQTLGVKRIRLEINSVGCAHCRPQYREALKAHFASSLDGLCADCRERYDKNILRMLDCKNPACQEILCTAPAMTASLCAVCAAAWQELQARLTALHLPWTANPRLVRGLDYYTRTAFEIVHDSIGAQATIAGGGRYDGLIGASGGADTPAVGGALGIERLLLAMQSESRTPPAAPVPEYCFILLDENCESQLEEALYALRARGVFAMHAEGSKQIAKQMRAASRLGARYAVFIGGDEWQAGDVLIKDMQSGAQKAYPVPPCGLAAFLLEHFFGETMRRIERGL